MQEDYEQETEALFLLTVTLSDDLFFGQTGRQSI